MWRFAILTLVACTEHGQTPPGGGDASVPAQPGEIGPFVPQICTAGPPGDINCPFNSFLLDPLGAPESSFELVVQPLSNGLLITDVALFGGPGGLRVRHPEVLVVSGGTESSTGDTYAGVNLDIPRGTSDVLPSISIVNVNPLASLLIRFDAIGTLE